MGGDVFVVRVGFRGQGITYQLAEATVDFARERGAGALEAYPMDPEPGKTVTWGEIHVGHRKVFEAAGFTEVSHPSKRRMLCCGAPVREDISPQECRKWGCPFVVG